MLRIRSSEVARITSSVKPGWQTDRGPRGEQGRNPSHPCELGSDQGTGIALPCLIISRQHSTTASGWLSCGGRLKWLSRRGYRGENGPELI